MRAGAPNANLFLPLHSILSSYSRHRCVRIRLFHSLRDPKYQTSILLHAFLIAETSGVPRPDEPKLQRKPGPKHFWGAINSILSNHSALLLGMRRIPELGLCCVQDMGNVEQGKG